MDKTTLYIDLLSHGEAMGGDILRGSTDNVLSVIGWQQMCQAYQQIDSNSWQAVITSPLRRCADFALQISRQRKIPLIVEEDFRELSYGDWDGMGLPHLLVQYDERFKSFQKDPVALTPPNGESLMGYKKRIIQRWDDIVHRYLSGKVLLICHNSTVQMLLSHMIDMPLAEVKNLDFPPAYFSRIEITKNGQDIKEMFTIQGDNMLPF